MKSGHPEGAERLERMRAAVRASPRSTTFVALAHELCDQGALDESEAICLQGLAHHPDLPTGQVALARTWLEAGKTAQAELRLLETIRQHPHHADAYRYLAKTMVVTGRRTEAIELLNRTRSQIVWTHDLSLLLESLTGGPESRSGGDFEKDPEITRVTNMRGLAKRTRERRQGQRRQQSDRRDGERRREETRTPLPPPELLDSEAEYAEMKEFVDAEPTPMPGALPTPFPDVSDNVIDNVSDNVIDNATPTERAHTPTGSFPPISTQDLGPEPASASRLPTRWALILGVPAVAVLVMVVLQGTRSSHPGAGPGGTSAGSSSSSTVASAAPAASAGRPPASPPSGAATQDLAAALNPGTLQSMLRARQAGRAHLDTNPADHQARVSLALVTAWLAFEHGVPVNRNERSTLTADLPGDAATASATQLGRLLAARALLALSDGDQIAAAQAVREATTRAPGEPAVVLAMVATRYRSGDLPGAATALEAQPDLVRRLGAARTLGAALQLDREKPDAARAILKGSDADPADPADALTLVLAEEVRRLQRAQDQGRPHGAAGGDSSLAARTRACAQDGLAAPSTGALCLISDATALRLAGDRSGALAKARQAAALPVTHPRTLGSLAQLLANLGEIDEGAAQSERAARFASPAFPALAWANVAIAIGRGKSSPPPAGIPVAGAEARVVAARAQVGAGKVVPAADDVDPDLRLLSSLGMRGTYHEVIRYVELLARQPNRSPVASYVGGELAMKQGRRHLAARLLGEALSGHGDSCQAARDYQEVLRRLKQSDRFAADVAPLARHNSRCVLPE